MKIFKTLANFLQLAAASYLAYLLYQLIYMLIQLGGVAIIEQIIFSNVGLLCLIDLALIICALVGMTSSADGKVKTSSLISIIAIIAYCILVGFQFDMYGLIAVCVLGTLNISLLLSYNERA